MNKLSYLKRLKLKVSVFWLFTVTSLTVTVFAAPKCPNEFELLKPSVVKTFPAITSNALPPEFVEALHNSPSVKKLLTVFGTSANGNELEFFLPDVTKKTFQGKFEPGFFGEEVQGAFLFKVLKELFPKSEVHLAQGFMGGGGSAKAISFHITDAAETPAARGGEHMAMANLKSANPGTGALNRAELRSQLGLPQNFKVVSLNNSMNNSGVQIAALTEAVFEAGADSVIINQSSFRDNKAEFLKAIRSLKPKVQVVNLSQLEKTKIDMTKKLVIINDTTGKSHLVYSLADINVVAGAVNANEATLVGTPSLIFSAQSPYRHGYDQTTLQQLIETAKATGSAKEIQGGNGQFANLLAELKSSFANLPQQPQKKFTPPYNIKDSATGKTAVDRMADDLYETMVAAVVSGRLPANPAIPAQDLLIPGRKRIELIDQFTFDLKNKRFSEDSNLPIPIRIEELYRFSVKFPELKGPTTSAIKKLHSGLREALKVAPDSMKQRLAKDLLEFEIKWRHYFIDDSQLHLSRQYPQITEETVALVEKVLTGKPGSISLQELRHLFTGDFLNMF